MNEYEAMRHEERVEILELLLDIQRKTAPIELSIGCVKDNEVRREIVIKSAPPIVAQKLIEDGYCLDITQEGVRVYKL